MKTFIESIIFFTILTLILVVSLFFIIDYYGWSDWAYKRFRTSGEKSLILGTSRAAQGIQPAIINEQLAGFGFYLPIFNFSFTGTASPYGELYYRAIKKKIGNGTYNNGLFLLSVDPWGLSFNNEDNDGQLREYNRCLADVDVYMKPNIQYMIKYLSPLSFNKSMFLHDDGWYELDVPMDSISLEKRILNKKKEYSTVSIIRSEYRLEWLSKTIKFLKSKGSVFLCRIPSSKYFIDIENKLWPDFDKDMKIISERENVPYISLINSYRYYRTIDGQHIYREDGKLLTKEICDSVKMFIKK